MTVKIQISYEEFKKRQGERISHDVLHPELGVMGATIIEYWESNVEGETLLSETANGGFSHYRIPD